MAEPKDGTSISSIWLNVLTEDFVLLSDLKTIAAETFPDIPVSSINPILQSLVIRGYASRKGRSHATMFKRLPFKPGSLPSINIDTVWAALKPRVGDHVTRQLTASLMQSNNPNMSRILNTLARQGKLKKVTSDRKCHYIVLPSDNTKAVATLEPIPIKEPDIMSMSIGDLFLQAKQLNDENVRLKTTLENIAQLLVSAGIVE